MFPSEHLSFQDYQFSSSSLEIGSRQDTVSIDLLKPVLGPPRCVLPPTSALVSPPMVQVPGLNPFRNFLPRSAPSLRKSGRSPRARPWSWPPVLGSIPASSPVLEAVYVRRTFGWRSFAYSYLYTIRSS